MRNNADKIILKYKICQPMIIMRISYRVCLRVCDVCVCRSAATLVMKQSIDIDDRRRSANLTVQSIIAGYWGLNKCLNQCDHCRGKHTHTQTHN